MSRLVRARRKPMDQLPPHLYCCDRMKKGALQAAEESGVDFIVSISDENRRFFTDCVCGMKSPELKYAVIQSGLHKGFAIVLDALDLDEGEYIP